jgi:hypothetical protein
VKGLTGKPVVHAVGVVGLLLFGLQTLFFGLLADLIVQRGRRAHLEEEHRAGQKEPAGLA